MPHGGGHHHGGGGFGGGHHHGGGGGHHHHGGGGHHDHHDHGGFRHHHHHRYRSGVGLYYGNNAYWYYRRRPLGWVFFSIFCTIAIVVGTSLSIRYTTSGGYDTDDSLQYARIDTRIIPVTNALCQNLRLQVGDNGDDGYLTTLYMLESPPKLTRHETFTLTEQLTFSYNQDYQFYHFYLHPGSSFTVSACIMNSGPTVTFYLFKGHGRFNSWRDDEYSTGYKDRWTITQSCSSGKHTHSYKVDSKNAEDHYYLVFETASIPLYSSLNVSLDFHLTQYEFSNSSVVDSCSMTSNNIFSSCSVGVPLSGHTAYLAVQPLPGTPVDWTDGIDVDTICGARVWMYVVISMCVLVGVVGVVVTLVCVCVCVFKKKRTAQSVSTAPNATEEPVAPLLSDQPFSNPNYHPETGGTYGSNMEPPPVYKP